MSGFSSYLAGLEVGCILHKWSMGILHITRDNYGIVTAHNNNIIVSNTASARQMYKIFQKPVVL